MVWVLLRENSLNKKDLGPRGFELTTFRNAKSNGWCGHTGLLRCLLPVGDPKRSAASISSSAWLIMPSRVGQGIPRRGHYFRDFQPRDRCAMEAYFHTRLRRVKGDAFDFKQWCFPLDHCSWTSNRAFFIPLYNL